MLYNNKCILYMTHTDNTSIYIIMMHANLLLTLPLIAEMQAQTGLSVAAYVHNRTPTRALKGLTPFETHYKTKPDLAHLRAFGAPCSIVEPLVNGVFEKNKAQLVTWGNHQQCHAPCVPQFNSDYSHYLFDYTKPSEPNRTDFIYHYPSPVGSEELW